MSSTIQFNLLSTKQTSLELKANLTLNKTKKNIKIINLKKHLILSNQ